MRRELVGREREIAALRSALVPGSLVAVTGAPGVGKTVLLDEVTRDRSSARVDLEGVARTTDLWAALGRALGVTLDQPDRAHARLARALQAIDIVVLDGCEIVESDAWTAIDRLRRDAVRTAWLVGSIVTPPAAATRLQLEPLTSEDACSLLRQRAAALALGRTLPQADDPVWAALADRLDGLPLAIELAASRLGLVTPHELLERLDGAVFTGHHRRQSVEGALRFAWTLLGARERAALVALSPLRRGFGLDVAEGLLGPDAWDLLDALRARSAIVARQDRLHLLDGLRRIALQHADGATYDNFVAFYGRYAVALRQMNRGPHARKGSLTLVAEHENLRAAFDLAVGRQPRAAAQIAIALINAARVHGPLWELDALGDLREVARQAPRTEGSELLALYGGALVHLGRVQQAHEVLEMCIAMTEADGPISSARSIALSETGWLALVAGDHARTRKDLEAAVACAADPQNAALALNRLGSLELERQDRDAAAAALGDGLRRLQEDPVPRLRGTLLLNLGIVRAEQGRRIEAEDLLGRALDDLDLVDRTGCATARLNLGLLHLLRGDHEGARALLEEGMRVHAAYGSEFVAGHACVLAALERWLRDDRAAARKLLADAMARLTAVDPRGAATARAWRAAFEADTQETGAGPDPRQELEAALQAGADRAIVATLMALVTGEPPPDDGPASLEVQAARLLLRRTPPACRVGASGRWFEKGGDRVDLSRRGSLHRILGALAGARHHLSVQDVFEAGWPGERALPDAAAGRVYNAVRELRALGFDDMLKREAEGYILDPAVVVVPEGRGPDELSRR